MKKPREYKPNADFDKRGMREVPEVFIHIQPKADSCDHVWDDEEPIEHDGIVTGSTLVCSKCKMTAFEHSLRYSE